jgi:hypothetical protein
MFTLSRLNPADWDRRLAVPTRLTMTSKTQPNTHNSRHKKNISPPKKKVKYKKLLLTFFQLGNILSVVSGTQRHWPIKPRVE